MFTIGMTMFALVFVLIRILCAGSKNYSSSYDRKDPSYWTGVGVGLWD